MKSPPLHAELVSSVPPVPETGGGLVLHRHLMGNPNLRCDYRGGDPGSRAPLAPALVNRLQKTRLFQLSEAFWVWRDGRWLDAALNPMAAKPDVIVTVAHGDAASSALRYARRERRPLVTFFHDWWPDATLAPRAVRGIVERRFRQLYGESTVALCVSEGMRAALGPHPHSVVLPPIPGVPSIGAAPASKPKDAPFRVLYAGNLIEYAPMLATAIEASRTHPRIGFQVRGHQPEWPAAFRTRARHDGHWVESVPRPELEAWLASADAFLVPMVFDARLRRRMETSFPSKLTEFAQYGKPIIVWAPEYGSATRWAAPDRRACCVTSADPQELWRAVEALAASPAEQQRLAAAARQAASTDFHPARLQEKFEAALRFATGT